MLDVFRLYVLTFYETFCSVSFKHRFQSLTKSNLWRFDFFVASDYFLWTNITARECYAHQWRSQSLVADGFVKGILVIYSVPKIHLSHRDLLDIHRLTSDLRHKHKIDLTYFIALWLRITSQLTSRADRRSVTLLRLPVWYSAQKDRRNKTVPLIQGIRSRIPSRRTQIERYLVWRARYPLQWIRDPDTRTMSYSNRIVSQTNCY